MEELEEEARKLAAAGRPGADGHRAGHDLLRHRPLRPADARRAAAPPVPHRRHRVDPAPLRLPRRVPRRGDRGDGLASPKSANTSTFRSSTSPMHSSRPCTAATPRPRPMELIDRLRGAIPDLALRTTLLVGYPGETEADFEELLAVRARRAFRTAGRLPLLRGGGNLVGRKPAATTFPERGQAAARGAR